MIRNNRVLRLNSLLVLIRPKKKLILRILDRRGIGTKNCIALFLIDKNLWRVQNDAIWLNLNLIYMYWKKCVDDISSISSFDNKAVLSGCGFKVLLAGVRALCRHSILLIVSGYTLTVIWKERIFMWKRWEKSLTECLRREPASPT